MGGKSGGVYGKRLVWLGAVGSGVLVDEVVIRGFCIVIASVVPNT